MILGAIIMPPPSGYTSEKRHNLTCESNLHALSLAFMAYCQDNDGSFPSGIAGSGCGWAGAISPYVDARIKSNVPQDEVEDAEQSVWACPDDPTGPDRSVDPPGLALSYAMNAALTGDRMLPNCSTRRARLASPGQTVLLFEVQGPIVQVDAPGEGGGARPTTGWFSGVGNGMANARQPGGEAANLYAFGPTSYATGDIGSRGCGGQACLPARHSGRANYLAADGHVAQAFPAEISTGNTPATSGPQDGGFASGTASTTDHLAGHKLTFSAR